MTVNSLGLLSVTRDNEIIHDNGPLPFNLVVQRGLMCPAYIDDQPCVILAGCTSSNVVAGCTSGNVVASCTSGDVVSGRTSGDVVAGRTSGSVVAGCHSNNLVIIVHALTLEVLKSFPIEDAVYSLCSNSLASKVYLGMRSGEFA